MLNLLTVLCSHTHTHTHTHTHKHTHTHTHTQKYIRSPLGQNLPFPCRTDTLHDACSIHSVATLLGTPFHLTAEPHFIRYTFPPHGRTPTLSVLFCLLLQTFRSFGTFYLFSVFFVCVPFRGVLVFVCSLGQYLACVTEGCVCVCVCVCVHVC